MNSYSSFNILFRNSGQDTTTIPYMLNSLAKNYTVDFLGGTAYTTPSGGYHINAREINLQNQGNTYLGIKNGSNVVTTSNFANAATNSFTIYTKHYSRFNTNPILGHGYALTSNATNGPYVLGNTLTIAYYTLFPVSITYTISGNVVPADFSGTVPPYSGNTTSNYQSLTYNFKNSTTKTFTFSIGGTTSNFELRKNDSVWTQSTAIANNVSSIIIRSPIPVKGSMSWFQQTATTAGSALTTVIFDVSLTLIPDYAFYTCTLLRNIYIPATVTSIGQYAFSGCNALVTINIPPSVTSLGDYCFYYSQALTSIQIPSSITSLPPKCFLDCSNIRTVTFSSGMSSIGDTCFQNCKALSSITLPTGITKIDVNTFLSCTALTNVTIPTGVTSIGDYAFHYCNNLRSLTIPYGVTSIGDYGYTTAIQYAGLTYFSLPTTITRIGAYCFFGNCTVPVIDLSNLVNLRSISGGSFVFALSTTIILPQSVTYLGIDNTFAYCSNLTSVTLGNISVTTLPNIFNNSGNITTINTYRPYNYNGSGLRSGVTINRWNGSSFVSANTYVGQNYSI